VKNVLQQKMIWIQNIAAIGLLMFGTLALVPGCTSEPKRVSIPASANAQDEISSFNEDLRVAQQNQVDVLSPRNFSKAKEYAEEARKTQEKDESKQDVLKSIGMAKAYLNLANEQMARVKPSAEAILSAREEAIFAGAPRLVSKKFNYAEDDLKKAASSSEKNRASLETDKRAELQRNYLDLQVEAIKIAQLDPAKKSIEKAKSEGARRYTPKTLASAEAKVEVAENLIETDRNNTPAINQASLDARKEASKLFNVTGIAKNNKASETVALELYARRLANNQLSEELNQTEASLREQQSQSAAQLRIQKNMSEEELQQQKAMAAEQLSQQKAQANEMRQTNMSLEKQKEFNQNFAWAQKQFSPSEAEVFRQGDNLVVRLKAINYKSGRSELPGSAYPLLTKVKDVITKMDAEKVMVQGHTDSIGSKILNQKLSQARAEGVAQYLESAKVVGANQVEAEGYGFEKPISTNRTSEGRSQNRRVDIIVTPSQGDTTSIE
jgi:OmpA-OmpF porin, OOP family